MVTKIIYRKGNYVFACIKLYLAKKKSHFVYLIFFVSLCEMNYWQLSYYAADYCVSAYRQLQFMKQFLHPIVNKCCSQLGYQFSNKEKQKVTFFYPLFNHIFNCENYLILKNRKLTIDESKRLAIISVMATLYDDLIDEERWGKEKLFQVLYRTIPVEAQTKKVQLIFALDDELKKFWTPTQQYIDALQLAIEWQLVSSSQLQQSISLEEVMTISKEKCGNSSLLWAAIMDEDWSEADKQFIYQSGLVGQLVNDVMDAFKDREDGVQTIVFATESIAETKSIFLNECSVLHQSILACNAPMKLRIKVIRRMATLHGFGLISIDHLQATENKYGIPVNWKEVARRDLITDMAFWSNRFKALQYANWLAELR